MGPFFLSFHEKKKIKIPIRCTDCEISAKNKSEVHICTTSSSIKNLVVEKIF